MAVTELIICFKLFFFLLPFLSSRIKTRKYRRDMHVFTFPLKLLSFCGIWQPIHWRSRRRRYFYKLFAFLAMAGSHVGAVLQCLLLTMTEFDFKFLTEILFTFLINLSICTKLMNFVLRKNSVIELMNMLLNKCCVPRDDVEVQIQKSSDNFVRRYTIFVNVLAQSTLACWLAIPLFQDTDRRSLPFQIWMPYDLSTPRNFWITYAVEVGPMIIGILLNATVDVIITSFMLQACTQLDILKHRLTELPRKVGEALKKKVPRNIVERFEEEILDQAVRHHDYIMKYAKTVNETFNVVLVEQFFVSSLILVVIIYELTMSEVGILQYVMDVAYLICMLAEFLSYCWFGNEITLKSAEFGVDIYRIDWTQLSPQATKKLLFIMLRTSKPIIISCVHFVVLNIESFKSILKVSYSAFNVLKKTTS